MKICIANTNLAPVITVLSNAQARLNRQKETRTGGLLLRIRKIIGDVAVPYNEFKEVLPALKEQYVAKDKKGNYKEDSDQPGAFECKSDEAAEEFAGILNEYNTISLRRWLTEADLEQLPLLPDELDYVLMVTKGEALTPDQLEQKEPKQENEPKTEEE